MSSAKTGTGKSILLLSPNAPSTVGGVIRSAIPTMVEAIGAARAINAASGGGRCNPTVDTYLLGLDDT